jgi:polysaccharide biosynthesis/export protein
MHRWLGTLSLVTLTTLLSAGAVRAQDAPAAGPAGKETAAVKPAANPPADFVIGPEDKLSIVFWRDKEMSTQVTVRPDGKISLPLLDEVQAAGRTPADLRALLIQESKRFLSNPHVTVVIDEINSRKVFITGQVTTPGAHVLTGPLTVMQLISLAGGLTEFAKKKEITVIRTDAGGKQTVMPFNYSDVAKGKNVAQNVVLKPGDTVVVP